MPLYLLFYHDQRGYGEHAVMLCNYRKLRQLLRKTKGFEAPDTYGKVLYTGHEDAPFHTLTAMLKGRYDFSLDEQSLTKNEFT